MKTAGGVRIVRRVLVENVRVGMVPGPRNGRDELGR